MKKEESTQILEFQGIFCNSQGNSVFWYVDKVVMEAFQIHWIWFKDSEGNSETTPNALWREGDF